jgi:nucleoside-diphosphate-sugar epimerase
MNVFITGGCGFIGSHLAERLTGFRPRTSLAEIVNDVVEDVRDRLSASGRQRPAPTAS